MTDATPILEAFRLGYEITSDRNNLAWFSKDGRKVGPYNKLEDAAYAAIAKHEYEEAFQRHYETETF